MLLNNFVIPKSIPNFNVYNKRYLNNNLNGKSIN